MNAYFKLCKSAFVSIAVVSAALFGSVKFILESDYPLFSSLSDFLSNEYLLFQFALPVITGLVVGICFVTVGAYLLFKRRPALIPSGPLLTKSIGFPIEKIEKLNWSALDAAERDEQYAKFQQLAPRAVPVVAILAPPNRQLELQSVSPIDLTHLRLFQHLWPKHTARIEFPLSESTFQSLNTMRHEIVDDIASRRTMRLDHKAILHLKSLYTYLSCGEEAPSHLDRLSIDIVIVAAARWSLSNRVDEAVKQNKIANSRIIFTGGSPSYDAGDQNPVAESEMMLHYSQALVSPPPLSRIHLETRSQNSIEALRNSLSSLVDLRKTNEQPLNLGIITSSFHMRRFDLQAREVFANSSHIVGKLFRLNVPAAVDYGTFGAENKVMEGRELVVLQTFLSEYLKLIGGRSVGEF